MRTCRGTIARAGLSFALLSCTPAAAPAPSPPPGPSSIDAGPAREDPVAATPTVAPTAEPAPPAKDTKPEAKPEDFPPPPPTAPIGSAARPGDGAWAPLVADAAGGAALLYRTTLHPDPTKRLVSVAVVAIDLQRVALRLVAGTREPVSDAVPADHRPGLVPPGDLAKLVAVLNGGFMSHHGNWGAVVGGETFVAPSPAGCSVAVLDRAVEIRTHAALEHEAKDMLALRQTPPCLLERGSVQPALLGPDKPRAWGMSETGSIDIRRSALGVSAGGRVLFYALGEGITPRAMAEAMRAAGAADAAELDVNWSYTRFLLYKQAAAPGAPPEVSETLIPKIKHGPGLYVKKASERDFFYLVRR